jgi:hypothetical protein
MEPLPESWAMTPEPELSRRPKGWREAVSFATSRSCTAICAGRSPLVYEFLNGVLHAGGVAFIPEACSQSAADCEPGVYLLQEQGASVAGEEAS